MPGWVEGAGSQVQGRVEGAGSQVQGRVEGAGSQVQGRVGGAGSGVWIDFAKLPSRGCTVLLTLVDENPMNYQVKK